MPSGLGAPADGPGTPLVPESEVPWLRPVPPALTWFAGREAAAGFFAGMPPFAAPGSFRLIPVAVIELLTEPGYDRDSYLLSAAGLTPLT